MTHLTRYQATHVPVSRTEVLCTETGRNDEMCVTCGRWPLTSTRPHKPNTIGSLGWTVRYGDGSILIEEASPT